MKKTSEAVKKSRAKAGASPTSFTFTEDDRAAIEKLAGMMKTSKREAIAVAVHESIVRRESGPDPRKITKEQLIAEITRRLK